MGVGVQPTTELAHRVQILAPAATRNYKLAEQLWWRGIA